MQAVSLAGSNFLTLLISYQLEVQDNENFILGIFLISSTVTKAL